MRSMMIYVAAAGLLSLAGCGAPAASAGAQTGAAIVAKADQVVLTGERGFAAAELAYITVADGVGKLVDAGAIHGSTAVTVRKWNARARQLLVDGKATTDVAEKARDATQIFDIVANLNALKGSN